MNECWYIIKNLVEIRFRIAPKTATTIPVNHNSSMATVQVTHSLTHWSRVLLEKLTGSQLIRKCPEFCGTRSLPHKLERPPSNFHDFSLYDAALPWRQHWTRL